jgi:hypothetical protein
LDDTRSLDMELARAESNVSVALARLNWRTGWVSRMPDHTLAATILPALRSDGVDVFAVRRVPDERLHILYRAYPLMTVNSQPITSCGQKPSKKWVYML